MTFIAIAPTIASAGVPERGSDDVDTSSEEVGDRGDVALPAEGAKATLRKGPPTPIGIRFGEPLESERVRIAYQFERIQRQGLISADRNVSRSHVLNNSFNPYERTPRSLEITTHTFQISYAPHPRVTLIAEVPFIIKELQTFNTLPTPNLSKTQTNGVGDISFVLSVPFIRKRRENSHVYLGIDVPTGSIRRRGDVRRSPYDSQLGNGSVDLQWGWTYRGEMDWVSWGGQVTGRHPVGKNSLDYREGSRFNGSVWAAVRLLFGVSASVRMEWEKRNNLRGRDRSFDVLFIPPGGGTQINGIVDPFENHKGRGGTRLSISPGLSLELPNVTHQRLLVEVGLPFHEDVDEVQLQQDWSVKAGWQWRY